MQALVSMVAYCRLISLALLAGGLACGGHVDAGHWPDSPDGPDTSQPEPEPEPEPNADPEPAPIVGLANMAPRLIRGINYLPRDHPFPGIWRQDLTDVFAADMTAIRALGANTIRTFLFFDEEAGLVARDGTASPVLLRRVESLLHAAEQNRLRVILCIVGNPVYLDEDDTWRRFLQTAVAPFADDGRILMWDLINEPGGFEGPASTPELSRWIQLHFAELGRVAPKHMRTIGLAWQFDQLAALGVEPEVQQYHDYSAAPAAQVVEGLASKQRFVGATKPLLVGEFGLGTRATAQHPDASETRQHEIVANVLSAAETVNIAGVLPWAFTDFGPDWMGPFEQHFGMVRTDGTRKPAGEALAAAFTRWQNQRIGAWEVVPGQPVRGIAADGQVCGGAAPGQFSAAVQTGWDRDAMRQLGRLYCALLDRLPDQNGFAYWMEQRGGLSAVAVAAALMGTSEYENRLGGVRDTDFVTAMHYQLFDRDPKAAALSEAVGRLRTGTSPAELALGYVNSSEARARLDPLFNF